MLDNENLNINKVPSNNFHYGKPLNSNMNRVNSMLLRESIHESLIIQQKS